MAALRSELQAIEPERRGELRANAVDIVRWMIAVSGVLFTGLKLL